MKRWILWNVRCLRGRRCADVRPAYPVEEMGMPKNAVAHIMYTCASCGSNYEWRSDTNARVRVTHTCDDEGQGITMGPGETTSVEANVLHIQR